MNVLFWNVHRNTSINQLLSLLIIEKKLDLVILAEYADNKEDLLAEVRKRYVHFHEVDSLGCDRIRIFSTIPNIRQGPQGSHYSIQIILNKYIFCCVHFPSDLYGSKERERHFIANEIISDVHSLEEKYGIDNTVIVGDMNESPYNLSCLGANAFHGMPSIENGEYKRTIYGQTFMMYYNPMWNCFGDEKYPPGTYYYRSNDLCTPDWFIFDQVIISPELKKSFLMNQLEIITKINGTSLSTEAGHPKKNISDHFPITFAIKED